MAEDNVSVVRWFYEDRVRDLSEPGAIGGAGPLRLIRGPDECEQVPAAFFEAVGFYDVNVVEQDNGGMYLFRADAGGVPTYGVLATTDGSDSHLEVYGAAGELLAAGILDSLAHTIAWADRDAVRRHAAMWG
jgi:hypothetical protein